ncbi:sulfite exporter TauE/SafE family protein [Edaphobacter sp. HDX4]|uniref:sulfite exporter TauE/SafE family protein n=1 Tax=Edaphobacter sp. HDX4 TaxID=2794064 RepID=UPI002FE66F45
MTAHEFTLIVFVISISAGLLGALTGLGGGIVVTPALTLLLGVDIRYAIGASLVSVVATSSGAAAAYVRDGLSNIRIGMFLEMATTVGAICGAYLASKLPTNALAILFGLVLLHSAWQVVQAKRQQNREQQHDPLANKLQLGGVFRSAEGAIDYRVSRAKSGFGLMYVAGVVSGMLGIGSGALKVIAMDSIMGIPFKVSTATSSFMIGVTGVASAAIYLKRGYIHPVIALPVMLGVLVGSTLGAKLLPHLPVKTLRRIFAIAVAFIAIQMITHGVRGRI